MKNLSTAIETTNRKIKPWRIRKIYQWRKRFKKKDELTMLTKNNRNYGDDNVNIDVVQGRSE